MIRRTTALFAAALGLVCTHSAASAAAGETALAGVASIATLDADAAARYRTIIAQLDGKRWADAKTAILALDPTDSMRGYLQARLYLDKGSPRADLFDLLDLIAKAPSLPQADQLSKLATKRGAEIIPTVPQIRQLMWTGGSPQRGTPKSVVGDPVADSLRDAIKARIVADDPSGAEALMATSATGVSAGISAECTTELRQRIAWSYYLTGDTGNARRMAGLATESGSGAFVAQAWWVMGLASWRQQDWNGAAAAFYNSASNASDGDMKSGGYFWAARATMADKHPERVNALLRAAAREEESFYGLLARETLGIGPGGTLRRDPVSPADWAALGTTPNARNAVILVGLGRNSEADDVLRFEAQLSGTTNYAALVHLASELSLPTTQLWLSQRSPDGRKAAAYARFPTPGWTPANGWQVERALVYAHALQESRFQSNARSTADARGIMQVLPGTGRELAAQAGMGAVSADQLYDPTVNLALGQLYLRKLAAMPATGGLLPKVVAAYNAGPTPIDRWNVSVRDEGDPLLFIESVPYYETRAYLNAVLRNYWVYQMEDQGASPALKAMAQGLWTRFPDSKAGGKTIAIRMAANGQEAGAD